MAENSKRRPALDAEDRENQLINAAINLAEKQIMEGTASSQVITHFLKLGSSKERYEKERLMSENELLKAKTTSIQGAESKEEMYKAALQAMKNYSGNGGTDET